LKRVTLVLRNAQGETRLAMTDNGPYPTQTGAAITGNYYTAQLPVGAGDVRYYIEAEDSKGNVARGALERVYLA
ncbi:MAG TPA: glycosyl hydrolase family 57, partial [Candidatus Competibacteraceae bacterium]|nr:glycosyl hydrolase family 57 [Candidatus Competibacteraceae bacterium]